MGSKLRGDTFTRFLDDIVDDTKDFVDDLSHRVKTSKTMLGTAVVDVDDEDHKSDEQGGGRPPQKLDELRAKIDQLTAKQKSAPESTA